MPEPTAHWAAARPHAALRHLVGSYIGYTQDDIALAVHRGLPSRHVTLVISLAAPIRMAGGDGVDHGAVTAQAAVGGLHLGPVLIRQDRYQCGVHVGVSPLGVRALLGVSAAELTGSTVDLADLPVRWGPGIADRLASQPDWPGVFAALDRELASALQPVTLLPEIRQAWRSMVAEGGAVPVREVANEVGWSRRHLSERFAREVGVTPKQAARLMRFERSSAAIRAGDHPDLAAVAAGCGYYDQAHMTNEWRRLAGCAPTTWIRAELPFLQDPARPRREHLEA